mgnify:CR=1 FL=1
MYKIVKVTMGDGSELFYAKKKYWGLVWLYCGMDVGWTRKNYVKVVFDSKEECSSWIANRIKETSYKIERCREEYLYIDGK